MVVQLPVWSTVSLCWRLWRLNNLLDHCYIIKVKEINNFSNSLFVLKSLWFNFILIHENNNIKLNRIVFVSLSQIKILRKTVRLCILERYHCSLVGWILQAWNRYFFTNVIKKTFSLGSHVIDLGLVTELLNNNLRRGTNSTRFVHLFLVYVLSFYSWNRQ